MENDRNILVLLQMLDCCLDKGTFRSDQSDWLLVPLLHRFPAEEDMRY